MNCRAALLLGVVRPHPVCAVACAVLMLGLLARAGPAAGRDAAAVEPPASTPEPGMGRWRAVEPWWEPAEEQRAYAARTELPPAFQNTQGQRFALVPAGRFEMGSPPDEAKRWAHEGPRHPVDLTRGFFLAATEVTNAQYARFQPAHRSHWPHPERPVEMVSWPEATAYCAWLTAQERAAGRLPAGWVYRLPTEAEWEYACRAGRQGPYTLGGNPNDHLEAYGWYLRVSGWRTHAVAQNLPNRWGLLDMHGNVAEWCADRYGPYGAAAVRDPQGPSGGEFRVVRGGSFRSAKGACRSASRDIGSGRAAYFGFRVVCARE